MWTGSPPPIDLVGWFHWVGSLAVDAGLLGAVVSTIVAARLALGAQWRTRAAGGLAVDMKDCAYAYVITSGPRVAVGSWRRDDNYDETLQRGWKSLVGHQHE